VLLWEAHSIASRLPRLFDGKLPDLNFGTNSGAACRNALLDAVLAPLTDESGLTHVVNGRFKGGWITRHFGQPQQGIHAIQLEMCQSLYMDETAPFGYREDLAQSIQPVLRSLLESALAHFVA
jgi:N-formylglutamate deformylase